MVLLVGYTSSSKAASWGCKPYCSVVASFFSSRSEASSSISTITVEIELDASDLLEKNDATTLQYGLQPQLAALELLVYPTSSTITQRAALLSAGTLEIAPMTAPRILFVWGSHRVLPVRLQTYTIQETQFDTN